MEGKLPTSTGAGFLPSTVVDYAMAPINGLIGSPICIAPALAEKPRLGAMVTGQRICHRWWWRIVEGALSLNCYINWKYAYVIWVSSDVQYVNVVSIYGIRYMLFVVPCLICNPGFMILVVYNIFIYVWNTSTDWYTVYIRFLYLHTYYIWYVASDLETLPSWETFSFTQELGAKVAWVGHVATTCHMLPIRCWSSWGPSVRKPATFDDSSRFGTWILGKF